jgi:cell shape-determining protein MreC
MLGEPGVRIAARTLETRRSGLVVGGGSGCELKYIPRWSPSEERPRSGEQVLTSGRLGFFPPGFLVGRIGSVGEVPESLHLNVAIVPDVAAPPSGRVWVLRPLPHDVGEERARGDAP